MSPIGHQTPILATQAVAQFFANRRGDYGSDDEHPCCRNGCDLRYAKKEVEDREGYKYYYENEAHSWVMAWKR